MYKISSDSEPEPSLESEYYQQILDARKLLTRQLAKLEKSDQNHDHENNLNKPTTSDSEDDKICDNFDPILEVDEDNYNEDNSDMKHGENVSGIQEIANQNRVSQSHDKYLTNESGVSENLTNESRVAENLTNERPVPRSHDKHLTNERSVSEKLTHERPVPRSRDHVIDIPGPLSPCYQPTLVVTNVWNSNMSMQRLYRYTTMQGIIYPPGYVP